MRDILSPSLSIHLRKGWASYSHVRSISGLRVLQRSVKWEALRRSQKRFQHFCTPQFNFPRLLRTETWRSVYIYSFIPLVATLRFQAFLKDRILWKISWTRNNTIIRHGDWLRAGRSGDRIQEGWDFPHLSRPVVGSTQLSIQWVPDLFPGDKDRG